jgi:PKD repeat protein
MRRIKNSNIPVLLFLVLFSLNISAQKISYNDALADQGITMMSSKASEVELIYSINEFDLTNQLIENEAFKNVNLPGNFLPNQAGAPNLPGISKFVAIPQGAVAKLEIQSMRKEVIQNISIAPAPEMPFVVEDTKLEYKKDETIYTEDALYPKDPVQLSERKTIRGVDVVTLGITPFQYNPVKKELVILRDIKLKITFEGGNSQFGDNRLRSRWFEPILQSMVINYNALPKVDFNMTSTEKATGYEYLIIIPDDADFAAWADTIKEFRTLQGIKTGVVTISDIGGNSVSTIKNYISDAYNNWDIPPAAVLIMADYGTSGVGITSQSYSHPYQGTYITDNYYADVANNDALPDIAFARMTARNSAELEVMVTKFKDYESNPPTSSYFYNNPVTACGWQTERWFQLCSEIVGGYMKNELGKTPVRINEVYSGTPGSSWSTATNTSDVVNYFGPNGLDYIPSSPSTLGNWSGGNSTDIINALNSGAFLLQHRDHGYEQGWGEPGFSNTNINSLTNTDLSFIFSLNCLTGRFDYSSECFAEKFHRYTYNGENAGALGLIAATQVSYSFVNDAFCWGMFDYMWNGFMPDKTSTNINIVPQTQMPAFASVGGKYFLYQSNWPYNTSNKEITYNLFHMHGDAFTTMYSEVPQNLAVSHNSSHSSDATSFSVSANDGAFIALTIEGEIVGTATATGAPVSINIGTQTPGKKMFVTITKQNYYRYSAEVNITGTIDPPIADFSTPNTNVVIGETVQFTDASQNYPNSWSWTFTGATPNSSNLKNPSVVYNTPGTYDVALTVTNSAGSDTETKSNYITVTQAPPVANFEANYTTIYEGETIDFTDLSTQNPTSWSWSFQGGSPGNSSVQNPSVTYNTAGLYEVSLTATNSGGSDTETKTSYITVNPQPTCNTLPYNQSFENTIGNWVQESSDDIDWTVQTGSTPSSSTGPSAAADGSYYIYIEASSPNYPSKTANLISPCYDLVGVNSPELSFQYHMYGSSMGTLNVQASTNASDWTTIWNKSGDQGNSWLQATIDLSGYVGTAHLYLRLNATTGSSYTSDICVDNLHLTQQGIPAPVADFTANTTTITEGESVIFTDLSTNNPTSWSWTFNGGTPETSNAQNPTITYNTAGTYEVSLTAANAGGSDSEVKSAFITVEEPVTCLSIPYAQSFENTIGNWTQETSDDMDWSVNSGSTPSSSTGPSSAFDGTYYIYMEASSPNYPSKNAILTSPCFDLYGSTNPFLTFQYHMYGGSMGSLNIEISTDGTNWTSLWTKSGDQGNSWQPASIDLSDYTGSSNVLIRFNGTTGSSYTSDICIDNLEVGEQTIDPPVADFSTNTTTIEEGQSINFTDLSSNDPTSWNWSFTGGTPSTSSSQNPTITYNTAGTYEVSLTVSNAGGADTETKTAYITVNEPSTCVTLPYVQGFENTIGNWIQESDDDLEWTVLSGSTPSSNTGPSIAAVGSYYIYIEASSPNYPSKIANLTSPCFDLTGSSNPELSFQYHMYGANMGTLNVQVSTDGTNWSTEWTLSGDQGNSWQSAKVNLSNYVGSSNVLIRLNGTTGSSYASDICVDDLKIEEGSLAYCASQGNNYSYEYIKEIQIGSYTHTSAGSNYSDYTNEIVPMITGDNSFTFTPEFPSSTYDEYWRVWIDFNRDGDFEDTGEEVYTSSASQTSVSGNISIPSTFSGQTRMRVSMKWNAVPTACESFGYGEVEDYTISVGSKDITRIEVQSTPEFNIYPNPVNQLLFVESSDFIGAIKIFNSIGELMLDKEMNQNFFKVDVSSYPSGLYTISFVNKNTKHSLKFIKK